MYSFKNVCLTKTNSRPVLSKFSNKIMVVYISIRLKWLFSYLKRKGASFTIYLIEFMCTYTRSKAAERVDSFNARN